MPSPYIELHAASAFSFLQGASLPEALIDRAAELGYSALALLDRDGVYGLPRFHKAAQAAGIRAIVGAELTIAGTRRTDDDQRRSVLDTREGYGPSVSAAGVGPRGSKKGGPPREVKNVDSAAASHPDHPNAIASALRRCRQPVPARVTLDNGRPVRVTTDRRGFVGGTVVACAGPWRTSGDWWAVSAAASEASSPQARERSEQVKVTREGYGPSASGTGVGPRAFNKDDWDVSLNDGAAYRIFQDRATDAWFIEAIVD